eukprot:scaffold21162_cov65-Attheya_sp.AAC.10
MVDEVKVKYGMVFNSNTLEPIGMANDDLDLKTVMRSVLNGSDNCAKPAVYVSQWRYKDFVTKTRHGIAPTISMMEHSIGSKVFGVCMDAGGNNARLMEGH